MGDAAVSALVKDVLGRLTSQLIKEFALFRGFKGDILRLKKDFEEIQAVLEDAEEKHIEEKAVELWLQRLRSASFKVENVLDDISTEALLRSLNKEIDVESGIKIGIKYKAPLTEELVFRACMISLLLCGGFKAYTVILLSPVLFSLAHLNHLLEYYMQQNTSLLKASMVVGFQLGYTVIFGSYASFLFVRTGHIAAPLVSHMFCNIMGLPAFFSRRTWLVSVGFVAGAISFVYLLFPFTSPALYNDRTDDCKCWHTYCYWT